MGAKYASRLLCLRYLGILVLFLICPPLALAANPFSVFQITDNATADSAVQLNNNGWMAWKGSAGINLWDRAATQVLPSSSGNPMLADNGYVVWEANYDIWRWDGSVTSQVNSVSYNCNNSSINSAGDVVYHISKNYSQLGRSWDTPLTLPNANDAISIYSTDLNDSRQWVYHSVSRQNTFTFPYAFHYDELRTPMGRVDYGVISIAYHRPFRLPQINNRDHVIYEKPLNTSDPDSMYRLVFWDGTSGADVPDSVDFTEDDPSQFHLNDHDQVVWQSPSGIKLSDGTQTSVISGSLHGSDPQINNRDHVVWRGENNNGIYYWNGQTTVQVSDMQGVSAPPVQRTK